MIETSLVKEQQLEPEAKARAIVVARRWTAAGILASLFASVAWNRPYIPGQFVSAVFAPGNAIPLLVAIGVCNEAKNAWGKLGHGNTRFAFLAIPFAALAICPLNADTRFRLERGKYESALATGVKYGSQREVSIGARKVTYWRWAIWGIDNTMGLVYDPVDRLQSLNDEEKHASRKLESGWGVEKRLAPHWYFITGT